MNLIQESYHRLFPSAALPYRTEMEYNRRLAPFNANIRMQYGTVKVNLNLQWKDIDDEIKIGLIQTLWAKVLRKKISSPNIDIYHSFVKNIPLLTPKHKTDAVLENSFHRINRQYFLNHLEKPNLEWGPLSFRKLAGYNFHSDTITVSILFQNTKHEIVDYLMYHELLHKHHQFNHRNGRSYYHSPAFKADEERFPRHWELEEEIKKMANSKNSKKCAARRSFWSLLQ